MAHSNSPALIPALTQKPSHAEPTGARLWQGLYSEAGRKFGHFHRSLNSNYTASFQGHGVVSGRAQPRRRPNSAAFYPRYRSTRTRCSSGTLTASGCSSCASSGRSRRTMDPDLVFESRKREEARIFAGPIQ